MHTTKKWALGLLIVTGMTSAYFYVSSPDEEGRHFEEAKVTRQDLTLKVSATGLAEPKNKIKLKPPVSGRLERILVPEGSQVKKGQLLAWMSSTERAAVMDAARAQGPEALAKWEEAYKPTPILSPISGTLISQRMQEGQSVLNSDVLFSLSDYLVILAKVDETDIALIQLNQPAEIVLDAYPNQPLQGMVQRIDYDATTENNVTTYGVEVGLKNIPGFLRSGMTANVIFEVETRQNALALPTRFIRYAKGLPFVLVSDDPKHKQTHEQTLQLGLSDGQATEVLAGVDETNVVLLPQANPTPESKAPKNPFSPFPKR